MDFNILKSIEIDSDNDDFNDPYFLPRTPVVPSEAGTESPLADFFSRQGTFYEGEMRGHYDFASLSLGPDKESFFCEYHVLFYHILFCLIWQGIAFVFKEPRLSTRSKLDR